MKMRLIRSCSIAARAARDRVRVGSFALILVLGLVALLPRSVYAADGDLDTTFGDPNATSSVLALALQSDGKVLIGGNFTSVGSGPTTMNRVARLTSTGALDGAFGDPNANGAVNALALQSDGKVLIGGDFTSVGGSTRNHVARLTSTGTLDATFIDPNANDGVQALKQQSDGKVLIGGWFTSVSGSPRTGVARLNTAQPTAVALSSFHATAPTFDLAAWFAEILRRWR